MQDQREGGGQLRTRPAHDTISAGHYTPPDGYMLISVAEYRKIQAALVAVYQAGAPTFELPPLMTRKERRRARI